MSGLRTLLPDWLLQSFANKGSFHADAGPNTVLALRSFQQGNDGLDLIPFAISHCQVFASNANSFERHLDVATTSWSSKRASEWGKEGDLVWLVGSSISQTAADPVGFLCTTVSWFYREWSLSSDRVPVSGQRRRARLVGDHRKETVTQISSGYSQIIQNTVSESTALLCCMYINMHIDTHKSLRTATSKVASECRLDTRCFYHTTAILQFFFCLILMREGTCCIWQLVYQQWIPSHDTWFKLLICSHITSFNVIKIALYRNFAVATQCVTIAVLFVHHSMPRWLENNAAWTYGRTSRMVGLVPHSPSAWLKRKSRWKIPISVWAGEPSHHHLASSGRNPKCQAGSNTWGFVHYSIRRDVLFIMFAVSDLQSKSKQLI